MAGSGPGGASVARELACRGLSVAILEQGSAVPVNGTLLQMSAMAAIPGRGAYFHQDASLLVQGITAGGSSTLNFATAAPPPAALFARYGIDLSRETQALQAELPMAPLPDELIGPMAQRLLQAGQAAGLSWRKLNKMIRPQICRTGCWRCVYGCPFGAKWTARDLIEEAVRHGAHLLDQTCVIRVLQDKGHATGVECVREGQPFTIHASHIILSGGGIGTPRILHASALTPRTSPFFSDPVVAVMGTCDDIHGGAEVPMAAGAYFHEQGFSLADLTLPKPMYQAFALQVGRIDRLFSHEKILSIMVKIRDEIGGSIGPRWVNKSLQPSDKAKFREGIGLARQVLKEAGARRIFKSWHFAAHPGGSVRIGHGVDKHLRTALPGLYACDASVIPEPWGLPPTLTLLSLGKRLGTAIASSQFD
ncbi:GMC family oxidoreductase [Pseudoduganella ginsengisoli]